MGVLVDRFEEHEGMFSYLIPSGPRLDANYVQALYAVLPFIPVELCWLLEGMTIRSKFGVSQLFFCSQRAYVDVR
jgi:hypothetical protein